MNFPSEPLPPSEESSSSTSSMPPPNVMELLSFQQPIPMAAMTSDPAPAHPPAPAAAVSVKKSSKSAKKRKSGGEPASAPMTAASSHHPHASEPTVRHKSVRESVLNLLNFKAEQFGDVDFAERALLNLARKVSSDRPGSGMADWARAVSCRDPSTPCVPVSRPKDGRLVSCRTTVACNSFNLNSLF